MSAKNMTPALPGSPSTKPLTLLSQCSLHFLIVSADPDHVDVRAYMLLPRSRPQFQFWSQTHTLGCREAERSRTAPRPTRVLPTHRAARRRRPAHYIRADTHRPLVAPASELAVGVGPGWDTRACADPPLPSRWLLRSCSGEPRS